MKVLAAIALLIGSAAACDVSTLASKQTQAALDMASCAQKISIQSCIAPLMTAMIPGFGGNTDMSSMVEPIEKAIKCICPSMTSGFECMNSIDCYGRSAYEGAFSGLGSMVSAFSGGSMTPDVNLEDLIPGRRREDEPAGSDPFDDQMELLLAACPSLETMIQGEEYNIGFSMKAPADFEEMTKEQLKALCEKAIARVYPPPAKTVCDSDFKVQTVNDNLEFALKMKSPIRPATADLVLGGAFEFEYTDANNATKNATAAASSLDDTTSTSAAFGVAAVLSAVVALVALVL
jgi:hypothetical protein